MAQDVLHRVVRSRDTAPRTAAWTLSSSVIIVLALVHPGGASAGDLTAALRADATPVSDRPDDPAALSASMLAVPRQYRPLAWPKTAPSAGSLQRPRSPLAGANLVAEQLAEAPILPAGSVWQRMAECRTNNRVRLLNLWISADSSVSLQAGRRGEPSLQWIYYPIEARESRRGLLDGLFSAPFLQASKIRPAGASVRRQRGRP